MAEIKKEADIARPDMDRAFFKQLVDSLPDSRAHIIFWSLFILGLALDLWTKWAVFSRLNYPGPGSYQVIDGLVQLVTALNDGAAFGMFAGNSYFLVGVASLALIIIIAIFLFGGNRHRLVHVALGFFAAGISGNLYDRIFNDGLVRDFVDVYYRSYHWPAFNVADSMLCVGVGLLIISTLFTPQSYRKHAQQQK
jgi:signal peptidase II